MIDDHLEQLRSIVNQSTDLPAGTKTELLKLVDAVQTEAGSDGGQPPAPAPEEEPLEEQNGITRLIAAVDGLEATHPEMTSLINRIAANLAKLGF